MEFDKPAVGDKVIFFDAKGNTRNALVYDDCSDEPGLSFVNLIVGKDAEFGEEYVRETEEKRSVQHIERTQTMSYSYEKGDW